MSRPRTTMLPPVHEDAVCPVCRCALAFGTDGNGQLIEWCPACEAMEKWAVVRRKRELAVTAQQHKATGFCTAIVRDQGAVPFVCPFPQAATKGYACDRYCPEHCRANEATHACKRGAFREYMRQRKAAGR